MELKINGTTVQSWTVNSASWVNYSHTLTAPIGPSDTVDIIFTNNYSNGVDDRDLFVDSVQVGAQTIQVESRTVTYDRNAVDGQEVFASDGAMWWSGALRLTQRYTYNDLGSLTAKEGAAFAYGTQAAGCADGALSKPHALVSGAGASYCYDKNGNMLSGDGRTLSWTAENLPSSVAVSGGVSESYSYNADSARVKVTSGSTTTVFVEGLYEAVVGGAVKKYYTLNGVVVALREQSGAPSTVSYLHGDHLGSISASTSSTGVATLQEYDAWGQVRLTTAQTQHPIQQTKRNYTGQYRDGTGLLFYHARYYDPSIGRFLSADTIVPGNAAGGMAGVAVTPLTVSFHEGGFLNKVNGESRMGFWFLLSDQERQQHGRPWGPANPQALNRYSYVQNNPLKYTDPTGHSVYMEQDEALYYARVELKNLSAGVRQSAFIAALITAVLEGGGAAAIAAYIQGMGVSAAVAAAAAPILIAAAAAALLAGIAVGIIVNEWAAQIDSYREIIGDVAEADSAGVIISWSCGGKLYCDATVVGRSTGNGYVISMSKPASVFLVNIGGDLIWEAGRACTRQGGNPSEGNYYKRDSRLCQ